MKNWRKSVNERGFPYYINNNLKIQQWDHPKFFEIKQSIDDCNYVVYSSYRLALKFRVLQKFLQMEEVPLFSITGILERFRLTSSQNSLILNCYDLESILSNIFYAANKAYHTNIDVDYATEMFISFLYNVFDNKREGKLQAFSVKLLLGILCDCSPHDLYKFLFSICASNGSRIDRNILKGLLQQIQMVIKYLHEDTCFGLNSINSAVEKCFQNLADPVGIPESQFVYWLRSDDSYFAWMPLVLKYKSAEKVLHSIKCTTCQITPLRGLRYCCVKCANYNQCQRCFLTARVSHAHRLTHFLREYSSDTSNKDTGKTFLNRLREIFRPGSMDKNYSIVKPSKYFSSNKAKLYLSTEALCDIEPISSPQGQLQGVIRQLENQNRDLQQMIIFGNYNDKDMRKYLEEYRLFMAGNIKRLKMLKNQIEHPFQTDKPSITDWDRTYYTPTVQSTPVLKSRRRRNLTKTASLATHMDCRSLKSKFGASLAHNINYDQLNNKWKYTNHVERLNNKFCVSLANNLNTQLDYKLSNGWEENNSEDEDIMDYIPMGKKLNSGDKDKSFSLDDHNNYVTMCNNFNERNDDQLNNLKGYCTLKKEHHIPRPSSTISEPWTNVSNNQYNWNKDRLVPSPPSQLSEPEPAKPPHDNIDVALAKLQDILVNNNFLLEESLSHMNNHDLKYAINEVEGMIATMIDDMETSWCKMSRV